MIDSIHPMRVLSNARRPFVLVGALTALVAAGCGGDEEETSDAQAAYNECMEMNQNDPAALARCVPPNAMDQDPAGLVGEGDEAAAGPGALPTSGDFVACATGGASADVRPVAMLLVVDRSSSMNDDNKWPQATGALLDFVQSPETSGLGIGLRFYPDDHPEDSAEACDFAQFAQPLVPSGPLTSQSGVGDLQEQALVDAIQSTDAWGDGGRGTPTYGALGGGLDWARAYQASHPAERAIVVLVTDGEPNGCDGNGNAAIAGLAEDAYDGEGILTYAIGLEGSSEDAMNQIAQAGGTGDGIFIGAGDSAQQEFLDALNAIRGQALACDFPIPEPDTGTLDPAKVNILLRASNGTEIPFTKVEDEGACGAESSWYYQGDRIVLCEAACNVTLSDPSASIDLVFGCETTPAMIPESR